MLFDILAGDAADNLGGFVTVDERMSEGLKGSASWRI